MKKEGEIQNIERIERLIEEGKVKSATLVSHTFQLWLKKYYDKTQIKIEENIKEGLKPSIAILDEDKDVFIAWQNVDPTTNLQKEEERNKIKKVALHIYSKVLLPKYLFLSNGRSLFVYDPNLKALLSISSLKKASSSEKEILVSILSKKYKNS